MQKIILQHGLRHTLSKKQTNKQTKNSWFTEKTTELFYIKKKKSTGHTPEKKLQQARWI